MLLAEVVATSAAVAAESGRSAKRDALAELLARLEPDEIEPAVGFLTGEPRQGRIGVGWRTLQAAERPPAATPTVTIAELDAALTALAGLAGPGSGTARLELVGDLLGRATAPEARFLARLLGGELRQGANAGVMTDAVARAADVPATVVRRAVMLGGRLDVVARLALVEGRAALEEVGLEVGRPLQPMLASTAGSVTEALAELGTAAVEWKLDGIRIQVHRDGDDVAVYTRNLNDITERLAEVVDIVRGLPAQRLVLDGEALVVDPATGRPVAFQDTASRVSADDARPQAVQPFFFDVVHLDGRDLVDEPLAARRDLLAEATGEWRIPGSITDDPATGEAVLASALAAGHEGVVVKGVDSAYEAGRRGKAWRKVKPVHTLDLVVLAAEWGHGRRTGWLSNLHLGARTDDGFAMVGKTFKGLTDELLAWQTERFLALAEREERWDGPRTGVVWVRPEQVVEIAVDGVQRSTRYPGGVALRFARVVRYRDDKVPDEADTIDAVRALLAG
ncbi:MAG: ATP-dependent DNA ligase [Acidimicrobiales bacterium]|nr:ATP-dependent DNA ligase [Acidimicrobiales bacterium]